MMGTPDIYLGMTNRRNFNRGYMKLDVWQKGMSLFEVVFRATLVVPDFKLRSQVLDAAQSVSGNIAEGYGRRTLPEYLQFLYYSKGSAAEALTRMIGLAKIKWVTAQNFEALDQLHFEVENKLIKLIETLERPDAVHHWQSKLPATQATSQRRASVTAPSNNSGTQ
jgi:four helix bundle protein